MKMNLKTAAGSPPPTVSRRQSGARLPSTVLCPPASERGIALVITLILLSVTLFMAIAFLAISRRERGSVITETDTVTARLAADSALANAEAQVIATVLQTTNPYNFNLAVSANYQNAIGYTPGSQNPTNVNYDYRNDGSPLTAADRLQNVANLLFSPRAPVFVITNRATGASEFRFYLDLNHNARFDPNGLVPNVDNLGFTNGFIQETGDPEWIGVLERPGAPHGPNNKFLSRFAFIAMPAGNTLDLNAIHNQAYNESSGAPDYFRNQGVGSWEINLAGFLADLNTNEWNTTSPFYQYLQPAFPNRGLAFEDAFALLSFRYNHSALPSAFTQFPNSAAALVNGPVDIFPFGPALTNAAVRFYNSGMNNAWPGANNPNHYFELAADLFDTSKITPTNFVARLQQAGNGVSTYDRYTFYRLLSQLGTDSAPESGKLNVNYVNVVTNGIIVPNYQTNLVAWTPAQFFTNAADRMLRAYTTQWFQSNPSNYLATYYGIVGYNYYYNDVSGTHTNNIAGIGLTNVPFMGMTNEIPAFGATEIPVFLNGKFVYQPAVQRILQLAANIYDATTNKAAAQGKDYPSVFRPTFYKTIFTNVFVNGFAEVSSIVGGLNAGSYVLDLPLDVTDPSLKMNASSSDLHGNVYGVPWIIGAKKGFPNFNEFSMESIVTVTRKLQLSRTNDSSSGVVGGIPMKVTATNQMYIFSISNYLGVECWNSYSNAYTTVNGVEIRVRDKISITLTNPVLTMINPAPLISAITLDLVWPGSLTNGGLASGSFKLPLGGSGTNLNFLSPSVYRFGAPSFVDLNLNPSFENYPPTKLPDFGLLVTNRLQVFILDRDNGGHIVDYVQFNGPDSRRSLNDELAEKSTGAPALLWSTNLYQNFVPWGVINQINVSAGTATLVTPTDGGSWASPPGLPPTLRGQNGAIQGYFRGFMAPNSIYAFGGKNYTNTEYVVQAPYTPTRTVVEYTSWQANDPLVHYLKGDLEYSGAEPSSALTTGLTKWSTAPDILPGLGQLNDRYQPWGKVHSYTGSDNNAHNTAYRDPLVGQSDDWDFPTYKLPSVGWLGRVHRGTPWQTVYLKATNVVTTSGIGTWTSWTGNGSPFDAINAAPVQDRLLFDLFSTALNENATRGQLPINVAANDTGNSTAGLAAWSAVFSGVVVPTDLVGGYTNIQPAGVDVTNSPLGQLVQEINNMRTNFVNVDGVKGMFEHVGDILSVSALSQKSPFLVGQDFTNGVTDALMEWLPQQTLSLLRVGNQPRFVVYSYGQTLKPALNGVVTSGGAAYSGMITNYQVVAETVTRSVVRIEGAPTETHAVMESFTILPPD